MANLLVLATENGIMVAEQAPAAGASAGADAAWRVVRQGLPGQALTSVIAREGVILAGSRDGVWRSDDLGQSWRAASDGLAVRHVRWLAYHPDISDREFAGTEPAGVFVSHDGAASWRACPEVTALREQHRWSLPYSPEAGCVRGFAFHGRRAYAAVEVGGALRSEDGGETWQLAGGSDGRPSLVPAAAPRLDADVHSLAVHPSSADLVDAATGHGLYRSTDGGQTWARRYDCYVRAVWADPADADHIVLGPADGVERGGRIEQSFDGGQTWQAASTGLSTPWRDHLVERFLPANDELLAVLSNGEAWHARLPALSWQPLLPEVAGVTGVAWMEG